ncbi:pirin-like C-terminal cupin domain-containing protein [Dyella sp. 2HG41-7]|uniref:pirin family protein n=1 Tax=Dyella sp. 2HG41-7 TaxID=2883239 RepID=UPI001F2CC6D0|nr:pirin-like C-terminal cupin domain-containing protein [Dyella sp. 2HG41-7]
MNTSTSMNSLHFTNPVAPEPHPVGAHCDIRQFRHTDFGEAMSPLVLVDHFVMTGPTFEVHPHAGMSAVTVLFEDTQGWMSSHDSVHNDHRIEPGGLHWTLAGRGVVHTQQPEGDNPRLNGLQLFVNLSQRLKQMAPATMLLRPQDVPVVEVEGLRLRVLAGSLEGKTSPLITPEPILILDGWLADGATTRLPLQAAWNAWVYARTGSLSVRDIAGEAKVTLVPGQAVAVSADQPGVLVLGSPGGEVRFVVIAGPAIHEPVVQYGPFVMTSIEEMEQTVRDFQAGKFGTVRPFT